MMRTSLRILPLLLLAACSQNMDVGWYGDDTGGGDPAAGTLRLDITPPADAGAGTLLPQSQIVPPELYEGLTIQLVPTRTLRGTLTASVARGWTAGAPTSVEPLMAGLVALPGSDRLSGAATSAEDGTFTLAYPAYPGSYPIAIVPTDASTAPMRVVVAPETSLDAWDQSIGTGIPVYGRVTGTFAGIEQGIAGVQMRLSRLAGDEELTSGIITTDETGWYVARVDEVGDYTLQVVGGPTSAANQVAPAVTLSVLVESDVGVEKPVSLGDVRDVTAIGVVTDAAGERFADAKVRFTSVSLDGGAGSLVVETEASSTGDFVSTTLLPGIYDIELIPPYSAEGVTASPVLVQNQRVENGVELEGLMLAAPARLEGEVLNAAGQRAGDVLVVATEVGFDQNVYYTRTNQDGTFAFDVSDVPLVLALTPASSSDGAVTHVAVDDPSAVVSISAALDPGVLVDGRLEFDGSPVAYGSVEVHDAASGLLLGQAITDETGYYALRVSVPEPAPEDTTRLSDTGDTGSDTGTDTGSDTGADTGRDTATDTGRDTAADTGAEDTGRDTAAR